MAWTGSATIVKVSDTCFRITGLSLAASASGVLVMSDYVSPPGGSVALPATPNWQPYALPSGEVALQDSVKVTAQLAGTTATPGPFDIVKSGTTHADFAITLTEQGGAHATGALEIYVELAGHSS